jgi:hypothetical protein
MDWLDARTSKDFGKLITLWIEGKIGPMPVATALAGPSEGIKHVKNVLGRLSRSGKLIVNAAQPGCSLDYRPQGAVYPQQRAAFTAFVPAQHIGAVRFRLGGLDQVVFQSFAPDTSDRGAFFQAARHKNNKIAAMFGETMSSKTIASRFGVGNGQPGLHPDMIKALQECYQVIVVDEVWTRDTIWSIAHQLV